MKCYFNLSGSHQLIRDEDGIEVPDVERALPIAVEVAVSMLKSGEADPATWRGWRLEAVDSSGVVLFTLPLDTLLESVHLESVH